MTITVNQTQNIQVLNLNGNLVLGQDTALRNKIIELLDDNHRNFVLNFKNVKFLDTIGLSSLLSVHTMISNENGKLAICEVNSNIENLLHITGTIRLFDIYDGEQEAVDSF
ncbi:MAG: STAS domain-containing protein [Chitinophagales bacterium]